MHAAFSSAMKLDEACGPLMAYEESELYPRIAGENLISVTTSRMHVERCEAMRAV